MLYLVHGFSQLVNIFNCFTVIDFTAFFLFVFVCLFCSLRFIPIFKMCLINKPDTDTKSQTVTGRWIGAKMLLHQQSHKKEKVMCWLRANVSISPNAWNFSSHWEYSRHSRPTEVASDGPPSFLSSLSTIKSISAGKFQRNSWMFLAWAFIGIWSGRRRSARPGLHPNWVNSLKQSLGFTKHFKITTA